VTHLGNLVGVLIDDELGGDAYDHAVVHLDECAHCRRAFAEQRWVKTQLAQAQPAAAPDAAFLTRLLQIPESEAVLPDAQSRPVRSPGQVRSRRLLGRTAPSRPLRTGQPAGRRPRTRTVAAAGFAASVVVGFSGAISGSAAVPTGVGASATAAFPVSAVGEPISAVVPRPGARTAVSVVYRRP
jgi:hypothetical protein